MGQIMTKNKDILLEQNTKIIYDEQIKRKEFIRRYQRKKKDIYSCCFD